MSWEQKTLGELVEALIDHRGRTPKKLGTDFVANGVPVLSAQLVTNGFIDWSNTRFVDQQTFELWMPQKLKKSDVLLTSEAPLGRTAILNREQNVVLGQRLFALRGKRGVLDNHYLHYWLRSDKGQAVLTSHAQGTTVIGIRQSSLRSISVDLPSITTQKAIADVLGALDDKIAANQRVIQLSEQLAMTFYRSTEKSESSLTFADVAGIYGGGTPSTKNPDFWDGEIRWATPTDITALKGPWLCGTARSITEEGLSKSSGSLHPEGSILMTSRATIGHVAFIDAPTTTNQGFINLVPQEAYRYWLYFQLKQRTSEFIAWANGATFLELSRGTFKKLPFQACAETELEKFNSVVAPLMKRVLKTQKENQVLAATRDELLPLLMNRKITVVEAEEAVGDVGVVKQKQQEEGDSDV